MQPAWHPRTGRQRRDILGRNSSTSLIRGISVAHSIACDPRAARAKAALREALLAARQQLPGDEIRDERLTAHLVALLVERAPRCVALYWPIAGEFDVRPALERWL